LASAGGDFTGRVAEVTYLGNQAEYVVTAGDLRLRVQTHPTQVFATGDSVAIEFDPALCTMFARATPHPNPPPQGGRE
jgi:hypothetical protein